MFRPVPIGYLASNTTRVALVGDSAMQMNGMAELLTTKSQSIPVVTDGVHV